MSYGATPELYQIIRDAIRENQLDVNTAMPGTVVSYDASTQLAEVQPSFKITYSNPIELVSRPVILDVPVVFPRSGGKGVCFPIAPGDSVLLLFSQRSLDDWIDQGGEVQVRDVRLHNLTDAIAIPGFYPLSGVIDPAPPADATCVFGNKILIGNSKASDEPMVLGDTLESNLNDLIDAIKLLTAAITTGVIITNPATGQSVIPTAPIDAALEAVRLALPLQNSDFIFGEKSP